MSFGEKKPNTLLKTQEGLEKGLDGVGVGGVRARSGPRGKGPTQIAPTALGQHQRHGLQNWGHKQCTLHLSSSFKSLAPIFCCSNFSFFSEIANAKGTSR